MPTTYTHYKFGKDVLLNLPEPLRKTIDTRRELFDIGLHGPDLLFYYYPLSYNHVNKTGVKLHKKCAAEFFMHAKEVIQSADDKIGAKAYIYGVVCHYALDSVCHKYVEKIIHVSGYGHSEIEMEWDRRVMEADGLNPLIYVPVKHLHPSKRNAKVIAPFYEGIKEGEIYKASKGMVWALNELMPLSPYKDVIVKKALKLVNLETKYGLFMSVNENKKLDRYIDILDSVYEETIDFAVQLIDEYRSFLTAKEPLSKDFNDCFGCGTKWRNIQL